MRKFELIFKFMFEHKHLWRERDLKQEKNRDKFRLLNYKLLDPIGFDSSFFKRSELFESFIVDLTKEKKNCYFSTFDRDLNSRNEILIRNGCDSVHCYQSQKDRCQRWPIDVWWIDIINLFNQL